MGLGLQVEGGIGQTQGPQIVIGKILEGSDAAKVTCYDNSMIYVPLRGREGERRGIGGGRGRGREGEGEGGKEGGREHITHKLKKET